MFTVVSMPSKVYAPWTLIVGFSTEKSDAPAGGALDFGSTGAWFLCPIF